MGPSRLSPVRLIDPLTSSARARLGTTLLFLGNGGAFGAWAASVPGVKLGLDLSASALGGALLCVALGAVLAMPVVGWLGGAWAGRLLTWSGAALAVTVLAPGFAPGLAWLAAGLLLMGASAGALDVCMNARAARLEQKGGQAIMSSFHAAFSLGGLLGTVLVAVAELLGLGVRGGLGAAGVLVAAVTIAHARLDPRPTFGDESAPHFALPGRAVAGIGALCFLAFMTEGAVADWSGVFLRQVAAFSAPAAAMGYAAFSAAMVAGRLLGDATVRRFGPSRVLALGGVLAAAGVALSVAVPALGPAGFALVGLGGSNMAPILFSAAGRTGPATAAVASVATLGYAGMLLGPPMIGILADAATLRLAIAVLAVAMAIIALAARRVR